MKKVLALILILMVLCAGATAETQSAEFTLTAKKQLLSALGDHADAVEKLMDGMTVTIAADENQAAARIETEEGKAVIKLQNPERITALFDLKSVTEGIEKEMLTLVDAPLTGIAVRDDVYSSLFITSRFLNLSGDEFTKLMENETLGLILSLANQDAAAWRENAGTVTMAELTLYEAEEAYLWFLDVSSSTLGNMRIKFQDDPEGPYAEIITDTADVTDWDETGLAIQEGTNESGTYTLIYSLKFYSSREEETCFERDYIARGESTGIEFSCITKPGKEDGATFEMTIKKDDKKSLTAEGIATLEDSGWMSEAVDCETAAGNTEGTLKIFLETMLDILTDY